MSHSAATPPLQRFIDFYQQPLNSAALAALPEVYHADIEFSDPAHRIEGLVPFQRYFDNMIANIGHCQFVVHSAVQRDSDPLAFVDWSMSVQHRRLNGGALFTVAGASKLKFSGPGADAKIIYHQDFFDLGAMLYERLPLLGAVVRRIRNQLGQ